MPARHDRTRDPALLAALLLARRGQAYYARRLRALRDDELDAPSLLPGWTRRHVAAHVGFNARALSRLVTWAATGVETPMYTSPAARADEIAFGATLPVRAIRTLSEHAAIHLDVEWRDLPAERWSSKVVTAQGRTVPVRETVWMRTREVWLHAVDLDNGGSTREFPPMLLDALLDDLVAGWRRRRADVQLLLRPTDRQRVIRLGDASGAIELVGSAADLVAWGSGRDTRGVRSVDGRALPTPPAWL